MKIVGAREAGWWTRTSRLASRPTVRDVELANVKMCDESIREIAVEEAIRLKEAGKATEIIAVVDRTAAGRRDESAPRSPWARPRHHGGKVDGTGRAARRRQNPERIVDARRTRPSHMGKQAIGRDCNATGRCWRH